jgi:hypothetical protein
MKRLRPSHYLANNLVTELTRLAAKARHRCAPVWLILVIALAAMLAGLLPARPVAALGTVPAVSQAPAWLEPRGLSIVDMVGFVPEDQLRDAILVYETGTGLVQYAGGNRSGSKVVIDVNITPRYGPGFTVIGCLGQPAAGDQWPTTVPASTMQIFTSGQDITGRIIMFNYTPAGLILPENGSAGYLRYPRATLPLDQVGNPARVPANSNCQILIEGTHTNLTARFTFNVAPQVQLTPLGGQTFLAHSYIGVGQTGELASLAGQMRARFGTRHDAFALTPPPGADYMFVKYAPTAFDPYAAESSYNFNLAGSGTYRYELAIGGLSVDNVNSMGLPMRGNWRDADQVGGSFLPYSSIGARIKTPEYFLPPGIAYDKCMTNGGCSAALLDRIYTETFPFTVYFYKVDRMPGTSLLRVPLKMVGPSWSSGAVAAAPLSAEELAMAPFQYDALTPAATEAAATEATASAVAGAAPAEVQQQRPAVFLPIVRKNAPPAPPTPPAPPPPPDDPTGCPCGWFDAQGQMYDFVPPLQ